MKWILRPLFKGIKEMIEFLPLEENHIQLLRKWLKEPHVTEFWQETEDEEEFRSKFLDKLPARGVVPFIISVNSKPVGYIQYYDACKVGGGWWPDAKEGTFGVDQFIGDPELIGKGFGTEIIKNFVHNLFSQSKVKEVITDPEPKNRRAIRAYEKVGFKTVGEIKTPGGDALLMRMARHIVSSTSSIEDFLKSFHRKYPGCTPASFSNGKTQNHQTSYDVVVSVLPDNEDIVVLDLACGDGVLLHQISSSGLKQQNLIGVDMSRGELEAAHKRLGTSPVQFLEGRAQKIPLGRNSVDFVLCHMAFMLMDEIEQVVSEIHRVLKPGGTFSAVVGGGYKETPAMKSFLTLLDEALREEGVSWLKNLGDKRTRSEDGLRSLFAGHRFVQPGLIKDFTIEFNDKPENLMNFFMLMYDVALLSPNRQTILGDALLNKLRELATADGKMTHSMGLRHISFEKST